MALYYRVCNRSEQYAVGHRIPNQQNNLAIHSVLLWYETRAVVVKRCIQQSKS